MNRNQRLDWRLSMGLVHAKGLLRHEVARHAEGARAATEAELVELAEPTFALKLIDVA